MGAAESIQIGPAQVAQPSLGDRMGFGMGLSSPGKAAGRYRSMRESAERAAVGDPAKACALLERCERLLVHAQDRSRECDAELDSVIALHAEVLARRTRDREACELLLLGWLSTRLETRTDALQRLARLLATLGDTSDTAFRVYLDALQRPQAAGAEADPAVRDRVRAIALPGNPLERPAPEHRARLDSLAGAAPKHPLSLYGKGLMAYHDGDYRAAAKFASEAAKSEEFRAEGAYIGWLANGHVALSSGDARKSLEAFANAERFVADHEGAKLGIARAAASLTASASPGQALARDVAQVAERGRAAAEWAARSRPSDVAVRRLLARLSLLCGRAEDAAVALEEILALEQQADVYGMLMMVYLGLGRPEEAHGVGRSAIDRYPDDAGLRRRWADACGRLARWPEALEGYEQALRLRPQYPAASLGRGEALVQLGRGEMAVAILQPLASSGNAKALYWFGRGLLQCGALANAAEVLGDLAGATGDPSALYYAASALAQCHRRDEALAALDRAREKAPGRADLTVLAAKVHLAADDLGAARVEVRRIAEQWPDCGALPHLEACLRYADAGAEAAAERLAGLPPALAEEEPIELAGTVLAMRRGDEEGAARAAEAALARDPGDANARALCALARWRRGDAAGVQALLGETEAAQLSDEELWLLGRARAEWADYEGVLAAWEILEQRHPTNERLSLNTGRAHYLAGREAIGRGDHQTALRHWLRFAALREDDEDTRHDLVGVHHRLALACVASGDPDRLPEADHACAEALKLEPGNASLEMLRSFIEIRRGQGHAAVQRLTRAARQLNGEDAERAQVLLGIALLASGEPEAAARTLEAIGRGNGASAASRLAAPALAIAYGASGRWGEAATLAAVVSEQEREERR